MTELIEMTEVVGLTDTAVIETPFGLVHFALDSDGNVVTPFGLMVADTDTATTLRWQGREVDYG